MQWLQNEFRGWSLIHFILDGAVTGLLTALVPVFATLAWWHVLLILFFAFLTITCLIAIWVRRNEGAVESRAREQPGIREDVRNAYRALAARARGINDPLVAAAYRDELLATMQTHLSDKIAEEFRIMLADIDRRTDLQSILNLCAVRLDAIVASLHYSDIKRLPRP
jgi:hypothetical protein